MITIYLTGVLLCLVAEACFVYIDCKLKGFSLSLRELIFILLIPVGSYISLIFILYLAGDDILIIKGRK